MLKSPAKLNLGLRILGRNEKNYHLIQSIFWPIDILDTIYIDFNSKKFIEMDWSLDSPIISSLPSKDKNILSSFMNWGVKLEKRIPIGAGLGGGSSNAGTAIRFLIQKKILSSAAAIELAQNLGADVPFFLNPTPSWVEGIGEQQTPLVVSDEILKKITFVVVVFPQQKMTSKMYENYQKSGICYSSTITKPKNLSSMKDLEFFLTQMENDLLPIAAEANPLIVPVLDWLKKKDSLHCGMTGSGYTCYGVFSSDQQAERALSESKEITKRTGCKFLKAKTFHQD